MRSGSQSAGVCALRYQVRDHPADMLFHGAFGEMHEHNKASDPAKIAAA